MYQNQSFRPKIAYKKVERKFEFLKLNWNFTSVCIQMNFTRNWVIVQNGKNRTFTWQLSKCDMKTIVCCCQLNCPWFHVICALHDFFLSIQIRGEIPSDTQTVKNFRMKFSSSINGDETQGLEKRSSLTSDALFKH